MVVCESGMGDQFDSPQTLDPITEQRPSTSSPQPSSASSRKPHANAIKVTDDACRRETGPIRCALGNTVIAHLGVRRTIRTRANTDHMRLRTERVQQSDARCTRVAWRMDSAWQRWWTQHVFFSSPKFRAQRCVLRCTVQRAQWLSPVAACTTAFGARHEAASLCPGERIV